jgi:hypothetical protein
MLLFYSVTLYVIPVLALEVFEKIFTQNMASQDQVVSLITNWINFNVSVVYLVPVGMEFHYFTAWANTNKVLASWKLTKFNSNYKERICVLVGYVYL